VLSDDLAISQAPHGNLRRSRRERSWRSELTLHLSEAPDNA
jgi:hypothetical protein